MTSAVAEKSVGLIESAVKSIEKNTKAVITIKNADDFAQAGEFLKSIKGAKTSVEEFFDTDVSDAHKLWKSLTSKRKAFMDPLVTAETLVRSARNAYSDKVDRELREAQAKLDQEARDKEAKEKGKLDQKIEKAIAAGDTAKAAELEQKKEEIVVHAPIAQPAIQKTEGISTMKRWVGEVTDMQAFIKAVASGQIPLACIEVRQADLNKHASLIKDTQKIAGVRYYEKIVESVR